MLPRKININVAEKSLVKQILLSLLVGYGIFTYGVQSSWISPMKRVLQSASSPSGVPLSDGEMTWVANTMAITAIFSALIHVYSADTYGRKISLLIIFIAQTFGWIILLISPHFSALIASRICVGVGASGAFMAGSVYVSEICQDNLRGPILNFYGMLSALGILTIYVMGSYLRYYVVTWTCLGLSVVATILLILVAPETPAFLVKKEKIQEATATLANLKGLQVDDEIVKNEIAELKSRDLYYKTSGNITFMSLLKNKARRKGLILGIVMYYCSCLNGAFTITTYGHSIIAKWGVAISPELLALSVPILLTFGFIVPITCTERTGRKPLLVGTFLLSTLSLAVLAASYHMAEYGIKFPWFVPVIAIATTVCAYSMGVMIMPAVIMNDMFPFNVRAKFLGLVLSQAWVAIAAQLALYDFISLTAGNHIAFYVFAIVNLCSALAVALFVPETKGKTVEQIDDLLLGQKFVSDHVDQS